MHRGPFYWPKHYVEARLYKQEKENQNQFGTWWYGCEASYPAMSYKPLTSQVYLTKQQMDLYRSWFVTRDGGVMLPTRTASYQIVF